MRANGLCWLIAAVVLLAGCGRKPRRNARADLDWAAWNGNVAEAQALIAKGANVNRGALHTAAAQGHKDVAELLVRCGARIDDVDSKGRTPAVVAMQEDHRAVVEYLVSEGAAVNLHLAAYLGDVVKARGLLDAGADINAKDSNTWTALHYAAYHRLRVAAALLIARGADVNARTVPDPNPDYIIWENRDFGYRLNPGVTPLHEAAFSGDPCIVEALLTHGAEVQTADETGATALHYAAAMGNIDAARLLLTRGAEVNARDTTGATPLADALLRGHVETARVLIAAGADSVDVKKDSATVRTYAVYVQPERPLLHEALDRPEWLELLLAHGADPNERDDKGNTPLHAAILLGNEELVRLFLAHGTDVNARNQANLTALHYAANDGRVPLASLLLAQGADVNARDNDGDTPLHNAVRRGHKEMVEVLLAGGAEVGIKNSRGRTPLEEAEFRGRKDIIQLLTAGAQVPRAGMQGYK